MGGTLARLGAEISSRTVDGGHVSTSTSGATNISPLQQVIRNSLANAPANRPIRIALVIELYLPNHSLPVPQEDSNSAAENAPVTPTSPSSLLNLRSSTHGNSGSSSSEASSPSLSSSSSPLPPFFQLASPSQTSGRPIRRILLLLNEEVADRVLHGNAEQELTNILNLIFSQQNDFRGTPPASKSAIESLPLVDITKELKEANGRCSICCEDFIEGNQAVQFPCRHLFDKDCVMPWLNDHCSCPVCRYELPVDDPDYEKERKTRMSGRSIREDLFFSAPSPSEKKEDSTESPEKDPESIEQESSTSTSTSSPLLEDEIFEIATAPRDNSTPQTITEQEEERDSFEEEEDMEIGRDDYEEEEEEGDEDFVEEDSNVHGENTENEEESSESPARTRRTSNRRSVRELEFRGREKRRENSSYLSKIKRWFATDRKRKN
eukprot:TRINITY_DN2072_c1_g2_i1.p1 TRINITY_DN2072_c1_g2~~TRINITY_DN2072_c1_g2_i1.p1  ORF type:complete len:436 (-),score=104.64 TRINITY_DN2072_c1_g2_i1:129-1436(-)